MNLKPFNLERALAGDPVITRNGKRVLQLAHFPQCIEAHRVVAHIESNRSTTDYLENGAYIGNDPNELDLFMAPKMKKLWIAIAKRTDEFGHHRCSYAFKSQEECIDHGFNNGYHYIEVEIEE